MAGNFIGTDVSGTIARGNGDDGVFINGAPTNTIGGTDPGARNIISGNTQYGVYISGAAATGNVVQGNFIGTDVNGTTAIGNKYGGVEVFAKNSTIGGTEAGAGNLISGNVGSGVILAAYDTAGNLIQGNLIGTDVTGTTPLGNTGGGVRTLSNENNVIGGATAGTGNVIAFNGGDGVAVTAPPVLLARDSRSSVTRSFQMTAWELTCRP